MIEVLEAFGEGKDVQVSSFGEWITITNKKFRAFNFENNYRIKPKYQPFTYEDYMDFMDSKVKLDDCIGEVTLDDCIGEVTLCNSYGVMVGGRMFSYESAFNDITFIDGSKFGKKL